MKALAGACNARSEPRDLIRVSEIGRQSKPRARVLFVTNMWPDELRPHYGSFIASQANSLARLALAVDVVYVRGFLSRRAYLSAITRVRNASLRQAYDVVHVHYGHTAAVSLPVTRRPLVISFCGEDLLGAPRDGGLTRKSRAEVAVFRQLGRIATCTITKSPEMELALPHSMRARNHVLPNGVDLDVFTPQPRLAARQTLGWRQDEKVVLFLGNPDDPRKNVSLARAAMADVSACIDDVRLHVAWGISPQLVPVLMNASDVLLFASRSEGSPNAIKEAMACTLPIVATAVGDIPTRLGDVANCWVCPDASHLAQALKSAVALNGQRAPDARRAVSALSLQAVAERLLDIYRAAGARIS